MKKAFKWLEEQGLKYSFHDYKKQGIDTDVIKDAIEEYDWDVVINKRGTTWRKLGDDVKETMDANKALELASKNPSIIKRPVLKIDQKILVGFNLETWVKSLT